MQNEFITIDALNQQILDAIPSGILFCDKNYIVRRVNSYYAALLGGDVNSILGRPLTELNPGTHAAKVIRSGKAELGELCSLPLFGEKKSFITNRIPMIDKKGNVIGMLSHILFKDPVELKKLQTKMDLLQNKKRMYNDNNQAPHTRYTLESIVGESAPIKKLKKDIQAYAKDIHPVLIHGSTGTGKELVAQSLHTLSDFRHGPFVSINCAAIPAELLEAELFGYAPGAFSGALKTGKIGHLELANNGTLFLDEVGDIPLYAQVKLLRALEEKEITRVGAVVPTQINFRLITATNRSLDSMVAESSFREDFYYRINTLRISMPPLHQRENDIVLIANHILAKLGQAHITFTAEALSAIKAYIWPGNVRQLFNSLVQASIQCSNNTIRINDLPLEILKAIPSTMPSTTPPPHANNIQDEPLKEHNNLSKMLDSHEANYLLSALRQNNNNITKTAQQLEISRVTLYGKMKKFGIERKNI